MKVIVGLGNPGHTFHDTRHNAGFALIQRLAEQRNVRIEERCLSRLDGRPAAVYGDYTLKGLTVRLLMPLTMMNESGEALRELSAELSDVLIACDDVNLPLGTMRIRPDGGPGGHHGLQSCLGILGTEHIPRLRIGVANGPLPKSLTDFVLGRFTAEERPVIRGVIEQAADAVEMWAQEGIEAAMNRYNRQEAST